MTAEADARLRSCGKLVGLRLVFKVRCFDAPSAAKRDDLLLDRCEAKGKERDPS